MQVSPGTYVTTIVPKSGWPVLGQTAVNSGQVISISYSRSGNWFGNVSSVAIGGSSLDRPGPRLATLRPRRRPCPIVTEKASGRHDPAGAERPIASPGRPPPAGIGGAARDGVSPTQGAGHRGPVAGAPLIP